MPRRSTPAVLPESEVPDPFATPPATTGKRKSRGLSDEEVLVAFNEWLREPEGQKSADLDRLIEVLARGNAARSKLAVQDRLRLAFRAGAAVACR